MPGGCRWLGLAMSLLCGVSAFTSEIGLRGRFKKLAMTVNTAVEVSPAAAVLRAALRKVQRAPEDTREQQVACPGQLIIVRHGQSLWNYENRFTGWANVGLSAAGRREAVDAAEMLLAEEELRIDVCFTSVLERSQETADIILDRLEELHKTRPPARPRWRLNERHYGALTGLNKRSALREFEASELRAWRASFDGRPPAMEAAHPHYSRTSRRFDRLLSGQTETDEPLRLCDVPLTESLSDTVARVRPFWEEELQPLLLSGQNVLLVGHANCLRALISCVQPGLSDQHLPSLGLPNALPLVYSFDRSGAPVVDRTQNCYIHPLTAHYLGDACVLFSELDVDGNGALDAQELDDSDYCRIAFDAEAAEDGSGCGATLLGEADNNNDGLVDFNEYMNWWAKLPDRHRGRGGGGARSSRVSF